MPVAFPGAYGWGAETVGGRGGTVFHVTNLDDSGTGSFRQAAEVETGARTIVFDVGGTIEATTDIAVNSQCTIAGQTAPGGGICLHNERELLLDNKNEIIIRYMRIRSQGITANQDAVNILHDSHHIILDHCSIIWGQDESLGIFRAGSIKPHHITVQWCLIGDGALVGHNRPFIVDYSEGTTIHHNLFLHGEERNPKLESGVGNKFDFVNNVVYNWQDACTQLHGEADFDIINNFYKAGAQSTNNNRREIYHTTSGAAETYIDGNVGPSDANPSGTSNWGSGLIRKPGGDIVDTDDAAYSAVRVAVPPDMAPIESANSAFGSVLDGVGATWQLNADGTLSREVDSADELLIGHVRDGTGDHIVTDISDHGGVPTLVAGTAYLDSNGDGISDEFKTKYGLSTVIATDTNPNSGYTWIEHFINSDPPSAPAGGPSPARSTGAARSRGDFARDQKFREDRQREWKDHVVRVEAQMERDRQTVNQAREKTRTRKVPETSPERDRVIERSNPEPEEYEAKIFLKPERKRE